MDCLVSALNAHKGGATRLELCGNLLLGGTTPTVGLLKLVKERVKDIPVFVMIRPRAGDFCYSDEELEVMKQDIVALKEVGADGFVFGVLTPDGSVDKDRCSELISITKPQHTVTFHRAFDVTRNPIKELETLISLGFTRVLTSGQAKTALEGLPLIQQLVERAGQRIIVMPGGGINKDNIQTLIEQSGAVEFHGSASRTCGSTMEYRNDKISMGTRTEEYFMKITDEDIVSDLIRMAKEVWIKRKTF